MPEDTQVSHYIVHNPAALLTLFGMFTIILSIVGLKNISIPWIRLKIEFDVDKKLERWLRISGFIVGMLCIAAGIFLYGYI